MRTRRNWRNWNPRVRRSCREEAERRLNKETRERQTNKPKTEEWRFSNVTLATSQLSWCKNPGIKLSNFVYPILRHCSHQLRMHNVTFGGAAWILMCWYWMSWQTTRSWNLLTLWPILSTTTKVASLPFLTTSGWIVKRIINFWSLKARPSTKWKVDWTLAYRREFLDCLGEGINNPSVGAKLANGNLKKRKSGAGLKKVIFI